MLSNRGAGKDSWESPKLQEDQTSQSKMKSTLNTHWEDWCWSWSSNTLATWYEELTHGKRPWCWERLRAGGEGGDREMAGWYHQLNGHELEQTQGSSEGQGGLACSIPQGRKLSSWTHICTYDSPQVLSTLTLGPLEKSHVCSVAQLCPTLCNTRE